MNELRELTDAELDIVSGGVAKIMRPEPGPQSPEPIVVKLVAELIVDILKILEPKQPAQMKRAA
jgi:hypothetical protein